MLVCSIIPDNTRAKRKKRARQAQTDTRTGTSTLTEDYICCTPVLEAAKSRRILPNIHSHHFIQIGTKGTPRGGLKRPSAEDVLVLTDPE